MIYICPNKARFQKANFIFQEITRDWDENDCLNVPMIITTPALLADFISKNQVNFEMVEKIFIENIQDFHVSSQFIYYLVN